MKLSTLCLTLFLPLGQNLVLAAESDPPNHAASSVNYTLPSSPKYDYAEALHLSLLFYHSQRSGKLGSNRRLAWRGDSCFICSGPNGEDLSGGYYEAANTMKWGLPLAWTITQLAFNVYAFDDGMSAMNEIDEAREGVKWGLDYLVNCISSPDQFVGQFGVSAVGSTDIDFGYFGPPEEYEMWVPKGIQHPDGIAYINSTNPSSEILGETAAAMAAGSIIFKDADPDYSSKLLEHSKDLYTRATTYLGTYMTSKHPNLQTVKEWYPSSIYYDELAWGSAWLYVATGDDHYLNETQAWGKKSADHNQEYSWDEKYPGRNALLFMHTQDDQYKTELEALFKAYLPGGAIKQTAGGLSFYDSWGSVSYAQNIGFLMMTYAKTIGFQQPESQELLSWVTQQINYALGEHDGRSWMVGFGDNYPLRPYHKSSYNSFIDYPMRGKNQGDVGSDFLYSNTTNRFILYGALEGGPAWDDTYVDNREHYEYTEVTQDYNAAITGVASGLIEYYGIEKFTPFTDCGLDLGWSHPNATNPPNWGDNDCYHTCNTGCSSTNSNGGNSTNGQNANTNNGNGSSGNGGERRVSSVSLGVVSVFILSFLAV